MKICIRTLVLSALAAIVGIGHPLVACAQDNIYELSPSQLRQAFTHPSPNAVTRWVPAVAAPAQNPSPSSRTIDNGETKAHVMPLANDGTGYVSPATDSGPLVYHGGPVMRPSVTIYPIFWVPAKLQNGASTGMSTHYQSVEYYMLSDFLGHGLGAIHTQYYQKSGSTTSYIQNSGAIGKAYLDTIAYPASGCNDPATPGNCLSDKQIQAEVQRIMKFGGISGGLNKIFLVFTSSGEGSCMSNGACSYQQFCAYHSYFKVGTSTVIYANEPFGTTIGCQASGAPSPNGDPDADAAATSASHELSEAMTDPMLNAWFTAQGNENGDLCAYKYGPLSWDGGLANQMWNGDFFLVQTEFDNHARGCYQVGP